MVAWLRVDTQTILTVGQLVVTKNPRVGVLSDPHSCTLALRDTSPSDAGRYMCQLNTDPMIVQIHHLQVYVPPEIVDSSNGEVIVAEGGSVALHCAASGNPQPNITWKTEEFKPLTIAGESVLKWEGEWLNISVAQRDMNCVLLCIASNGIPPSVSKRIHLFVLSRPRVKAVQQQVGAHIYSATTLRFYIEAYPPPVIHWNDMRGNRLMNGLKYETKTISRGYVHVSSLTVNNVSREDAGLYQCLAENSLGADNSTVTLYTLATSIEISTSSVRTVTSSDPVTNAANFTTPEFTATEVEHLTSILPSKVSHHQMQNPDLTTVS
ncbi:PREDICTED: opioid-binding protein/cell adhesion molecule-like [Papilio xuthus]|uniref:Opioid-binding protein/cell adhesion molecule-like n=1 Tax=Papilio xuthus TaxID=66420 RepID=A0AAJ7E665_PAPXU|nr:PREDICTED: opioid-binding protein/cell adhesion molecule-like [Papilio xuthus]